MQGGLSGGLHKAAALRTNRNAEIKNKRYRVKSL
jgi:hypothetical protein